MPNGDPNWGIEKFHEVEKFFSKIEAILENFAEEHNLLIEKYYHQGEDWSFLFKHSQGGIGKIQAQKKGENKVVLYPLWWIDDFAENRRDHINGEPVVLTLNKLELQQELQKMLVLILSWRKEDLTIGASDDLCKMGFSRKDFERQQAKYPTPT